jgi:hypothetical protein
MALMNLYGSVWQTGWFLILSYQPSSSQVEDVVYESMPIFYTFSDTEHHLCKLRTFFLLAAQSVRFIPRDDSYSLFASRLADSAIKESPLCPTTPTLPHSSTPFRP